MVNPFPNKPWFLRFCSKSPLKTLWEKEKLLVTSNFSFSHSVVYLLGELPAIFIKFEIVVCRLFQFESVWNLSFGKELKIMNNLNEGWSATSAADNDYHHIWDDPHDNGVGDDDDGDDDDD